MAFVFRKYLEDNFYKINQGTHVTYVIPVEDFNKLPIKRWKYNRPEDAARVAEIHEWMQTSRRMDGMIYLAFVDNELVCYESNHRREALKGLDDIHDIVVDVMWNATDDDVRQEFLRLNKAISVPELYIADDLTTVVTEVRKAVDQFCKNYSKLCVTSARPQRPNFNREMLTDEFVRLMREHNLTITQLVENLTQVNQRMAGRDRSKLSDRVVAKCEESGLWLFAWSSKIQL